MRQWHIGNQFDKEYGVLSMNDADNGSGAFVIIGQGSGKKYGDDDGVNVEVVLPTEKGLISCKADGGPATSEKTKFLVELCSTVQPARLDDQGRIKLCEEERRKEDEEAAKAEKRGVSQKRGKLKQVVQQAAPTSSARSEKVSSSSSADPEPEVWILCPLLSPSRLQPETPQGYPSHCAERHAFKRPSTSVDQTGSLSTFSGQVRPETVDGRWRTGIICAARPHHDEGYV